MRSVVSLPPLLNLVICSDGYFLLASLSGQNFEGRDFGHAPGGEHSPALDLFHQVPGQGFQRSVSVNVALASHLRVC